MRGMKATIDTVALAALVCAVVALVAVSALAVFATNNLLATNDLTLSRQRVVSSLEALRFHALAINSGQQNYALTGSERDFTGYQQSVDAIETELASLSKRASDLAALETSIAPLTAAVKAVIVRQNAMVEVRRMDGFAAAQALARAHIDADDNERLLTITSTVLGEVRKNLDTLAVKDTEFGRKVEQWVFWLLLATALVLVLLYAFLRRLNRQQRNAQAIMQHQATHDELTGLFNRAAAVAHIGEKIGEPSTRALGGFALLLLDLDGFKAINDTLGHDAGDLLLKETSARLAQALRDTDFLARLGGDEFLVVLPQISDDSTAARVAQKLINAISPAFTLGAASGSVTLSVGISLFPRDSREREALMKCADLALYEAKRAGRNQAKIFDETLTGAPRP
jgi:diguanylate cyclase (GGDEF)-like protein